MTTTHEALPLSDLAREALRACGLRPVHSMNFERVSTETEVTITATPNFDGKAWTLVLVSEHGHETLLWGREDHCDHVLAHTLRAICEHFALTTY